MVLSVTETLEPLYHKIAKDLYGINWELLSYIHLYACSELVGRFELTEFVMSYPLSRMLDFIV